MLGATELYPLSETVEYTTVTNRVRRPLLDMSRHHLGFCEARFFTAVIVGAGKFGGPSTFDANFDRPSTFDAHFDINLVRCVSHHSI